MGIRTLILKTLKRTLSLIPLITLALLLVYFYMLIQIHSKRTGVGVNRTFDDKAFKILHPVNGKPRPWFMTGGVIFPSPSKNLTADSVAMYYDRKTHDDDRIVDQLMYIIDDPINVDVGTLAARNFTEEDSENLELFTENHTISGSKTKIMNIFFSGYWDYSILKIGRHIFLKEKCPVNACRVMNDKTHRIGTEQDADVVVFAHNFNSVPNWTRRPEQLWIVFEGECPYHSKLKYLNVPVNLTAVYRHDSDIPNRALTWVYFNESVRAINHSTNFAAGKTSKVAMFVSNCYAKNNRLKYAKELGKHIQVDIYGRCGPNRCDTSIKQNCFNMLSKDYKFYLAFENSNCREYISEKFFENALGNNVLPIVMGAHPDDYARAGPANSYIHVDDFSSPKELAKYLHKLDENDYLYNEYFKWKETGEVISTRFYCRLCAMAHHVQRHPKVPSYYEPKDLISKWWNGKHVCTKGSWKSVPDIFAGSD